MSIRIIGGNKGYSLYKKDFRSGGAYERTDGAIVILDGTKATWFQKDYVCIVGYDSITANDRFREVNITITVEN